MLEQLMTEDQRNSLAIERNRIIVVQPGFVNNFSDNKVQTAKYNCLTFIPKNLVEQFRRLANIYFLVIAVLQWIPAISVSGGIPNILLPLLVVLTISAIKDAIEDSKRRKQDREENSRTVHRLFNGEWVLVEWHMVQVGDIVKVIADEYFPSDIAMLSSSQLQGDWYIETKSIDGETNLKRKVAHKETMSKFTTEASFDGLDAEIVWETPNPIIFQFNATFNFANRTIFFTHSQFLPRGACLKNTDHVIGIAIYTGHETKIMMNSVSARAKFSQLETLMNKQILLLFVFQIVLCLVWAAVYVTWLDQAKDKTQWYLDLDNSQGRVSVQFLFRFLSWMLMFSNFVPISLIVTLEMVKFFQAIFLTWDLDLYDSVNNIPAAVQSSNLNEDLGQIHYIFSDKTGTLTCNSMEFRKFSMDGVLYGTDERMSSGDKRPYLNFVDPSFDTIQHSEKAVDFFSHLAICHTIVRNFRSETEPYMASSPDELALVHAAKFFGIEFVERDHECIHLWVNGTKVSYPVLDTIEFTSTRAKMSVVIQTSPDSVRLLSKGSDAAILPQVAHCRDIERSLTQLESFANEGLRTLAIAQRDMSMVEYQSWRQIYDEAMSDVQKRDEKVEAAALSLEDKYTLIGFTAIEDKLQDNVPESIAILKSAGIKVWVLTGDKIETAVNIGYSSQLLTDQTKKIYIDGDSTREVKRQLREGESSLEPDTKFAMVLSGEALLRIQAMAETEMLPLFIRVAEAWEVVIACRISPAQKAEIVNFIKDNKPNIRTLAIGDGANDVNMISTAHIGVGIAGKEGNSAVRASDYSFSQFSFLTKLVLVHGREFYRRNSTLICYNFYKNCLLVMPLFFFGIFSVYSGQTVYNLWMYQIYNVVFTSFPIIFYAVFDKEVEPQVLLQQPMKYYSIGLHSELFSYRIFWLWILEASVLGFLPICVGMIGLSTTSEANGRTQSFWTVGVLVYSLVCTIANLKILQISYVHYWFSVAVLIISIASYWICSWLIWDWLPLSVVFGNWDERGSTTRTVTSVYSWIIFAGIITIFYIYQSLFTVLSELKKICKGQGSRFAGKRDIEVSMAIQEEDSIIN